MSKKQSSFLSIAKSKDVVVISLKMSLIVGTILAIINHGPAITHGIFSQERYFQILLTYVVPYCVSTISSVKAIQNRVDSTRN